jgi:pimeloyl-ACP methyl ester carboxylesterase
VKVVLLHAFPLDERMWEPQLAALSEHEVVTPRLYGRGNAIEDWAAAILGEVEGEFAAVGASMGGYCALAMARREPDRLRALVLAGSRAAADTPERRRERDVTIRDLHRRGSEAVWDESDLANAPSADELAAVLEALRDRPDATEIVRDFRRPLLIAVGTEDPLLSISEARSLAEQAPDGRLEVVEGAGHLVSVDRPDAFNRLLTEVLADV